MKRPDRDLVILFAAIWLAFLVAMIVAVVVREPMVVDR